MGNRADVQSQTEEGRSCDWQSTRLGDVNELLMGNSPPGSTYNEQGDGLPLINGPAEYGPRHPRPVKWTTAPSRICKAGDVLVCVRGNTTGRLCIADAEYCIGRGVAAIRGKSGTYSNAFLEFVLLHQQSRILDLATGGGSTFPNINKPQLQELAVPFPPLPEQQAIAQVLRTVQRAKEATEKVLAASKQLKQSLLRHLFTYGPVPFDQADQVELKETEIGPMPGHWEVGPLKSISRLASGGTPSKQRPDFWRGSIAWVSPKDMKSPRLWDAEDHISQQGLEDGSRLVPPGTLFIVVRGMILAKQVPLALAMTSMAFNQDMKAILPNDQVLSSEYLLYALIRHRDVLLPEIGTSAHGTRRISTSAIENFPIPLPPRREQEIIAAALATVDRKAEKEAARHRALSTHFNTLLHHLMTGKVRVV